MGTNMYKSNNVNEKLRLRWSLLPSPTTSASDSGAGAPGAPKKAGSHEKNGWKQVGACLEDHPRTRCFPETNS